MQRHPALRGAAAPFSPFELQLLQSPHLLATTHDAMSSWLDDTCDDALMGGTSANGWTELESCLHVWWLWMASVAELESQEEQPDEDHTKSRSSPYTTRSHARNGADSPRTALGATHRSTRSASQTRRPSAADRTQPVHTDAEPNSRRSTHPAHALWYALAHQRDSTAGAEFAENVASSAQLLRDYFVAPIGGVDHADHDIIGHAAPPSAANSRRQWYRHEDEAALAHEHESHQQRSFHSRACSDMRRVDAAPQRSSRLTVSFVLHCSHA